MMFRKQRWRYKAEVSDGALGFECDAKDVIDMLKQTIYQLQRQTQRKEIDRVIIEKVKKE